VNNPLPFITVMMPAYNEEAYIRESLLSLISTGYPQNRMEIIVADGQSTDRTREEVAKVTEQYSFVRLINNPEKLQSAGCNRAAAEALPQSEYFIRVDAHSNWSPNFLPLCIQAAQETGADLVVFVNAPIGITPFQKAVAFALRHPLGMGNSTYRHGNTSGWVEHGQHGCFTRKIWGESGGYNLNPYLRANEDVELSFRIRSHGGKIWLEKALRMAYFPRDSSLALFKQYYHYGVGRFFNFWISKVRLKPRHFMPVSLAVALILGLALAYMGYPFPLIGILTIYFLSLVIGVIKYFKEIKGLFWPYFFTIFPAIHLGWAFGFLGGLCKYIRSRLLSI